MNMDRMRTIPYILLSVLTLASCVRDEIEPCPPLQVRIEVKDKNYFNVRKVDLEEALPEDLAFREYVPTLYYVLRDAATGEVVEEQGVFRVTGDGKAFPITFCDCIPHGRYILTVWGGLEDLEPLADDRASIAFHPGNGEGNDIYMTNDTLVYDAWNYDHTVEMERTKGKLIIQAVNLPTDLTCSDKTVTGLHQGLDCGFRYTDLTTFVRTQAGWEAGAPEIVTKTVLSPSSVRDGSVLSLNLYDDPRRETPRLSSKDVRITMERNMLTVLRYVYDGNGGFTIYILVNDNWEKVHGMEID